MIDQLCDVDEIRARLRLPEGDEEQEAVLDAIRLAVEEVILARTGYTFSGGVRTEQQIDVQLGISRLMEKRPIVAMSSDPLKAVKLEGRSLASGTFSTIIGDVRNAREGRIMPLASELTPIFPPIGGLAPWFRWRQLIWPVVRFTYDVDPLGSTTNPVPVALNRAAVEWVAAIYSKPSGGSIKSYSLEKVSETFNVEQSEPPVIHMLLSRHVREQSSLVF